MPAWLRSVLSVLTGFVVFYALQGVCTYIGSHVLHQNFDSPTHGYLLANIAYTLAAALIGGYVAARIAPRAPFAHGAVTALLMLPLAILNLSKGFGSQETWAVVIRSVGTPVFAVLGAALDASRHRRMLQ